MISINSNLIHSKIASFGKELKSGDFVVFKVISGAGNHYQISIKGNIIPVKSDLALKLGSSIKAKIIKTGSDFQLKIQTEDSSPDTRFVLERLSLRLMDNGSYEKIIRAFMRSGLPLDKKLLENVPQSVRKLSSKEDRAARILSLLLSKSMPVNEVGFNYLLGLTENGDFGQGSKNPKNPKEKKENIEEKNHKKLIDELKRQWSPGDSSHYLHLFNHIASKTDHWLILPFSSKKIDNEINGFVSLHINRETHSPVSAYIRCFFQKNQHDFYLKWSSVINKHHLLSTAGKYNQEDKQKNSCWLKFIEKLQNLGVDFVDNKNGDTRFDGFSNEADVNVSLDLERFV